jgi:hypothetical protein
MTMEIEREGKMRRWKDQGSAAESLSETESDELGDEAARACTTLPAMFSSILRVQRGFLS